MAKSEVLAQAIVEPVFEPVFETALEHEEPPVLVSDALRVDVLRDYAYVVLRLRLDEQGVTEALSRLNLSLPTALQTSGSLQARLVKWISPDEYLVTLPLSDKDAFMREASAAFAGLFAAVVDNSGGYVLLKISGDQRYELMSKLCFYDLRRQLPVGKVVSTVAAKAGAIFYRVDEDSLLMMVRWSFAKHVWRSLVHASAEYQALDESESIGTVPLDQ